MSCATPGRTRRVRREAHGVRVVYLRIGLVIGTDGGFITRMLTPFEFGLGGPLGSGRQWMSWIERDDLIRLIAHVIAKPELTRADQRHGADPGDQYEVHRGIGPPAAPAGDLPDSRRAAAPRRRRLCRRSCWAASACCRTRRSATALCSATKRCAARSRRSLRGGAMCSANCSRAMEGWLAGCAAATGVLCAIALVVSALRPVVSFLSDLQADRSASARSFVLGSGIVT